MIRDVGFVSQILDGDNFAGRLGPVQDPITPRGHSLLLARVVSRRVVIVLVRWREPDRGLEEGAQAERGVVYN